MNKHTQVRKLLGQCLRMEDGRAITLLRVDVRVGEVPLVMCRFGGKLHSLPVNDPRITWLLV